METVQVHIKVKKQSLTFRSSLAMENYLRTEEAILRCVSEYSRTSIIRGFLGQNFVRPT